MPDGLMKFLIIYYANIFVLVGILGGAAISLSCDVYELEDCLSNIKDFTHCIFMYQYETALLLDMCGVNKAGIFIAEVFVTLNVWFMNIIIFAILVILLVLKFLFLLFCFAFRKRGWR